MHKVRLLLVISTIFALTGCAAAVLPMIAAEGAAVGFSGYKVIQTTTGGSVEIKVDVSKLTSEQRQQIRGIHRLAVWPEKDGGSVTLAERLSQGSQFAIVTPSQVDADLKTHELPSDLKQMTTTEQKDDFAKVCENTNADAVIYSTVVGQDSNMNTWSFKRANITLHALVSISFRNAAVNAITIPVTAKILVGEHQASGQEVNDAANTEVANEILAIASGQSVTTKVASHAVENKGDGSR